MIDLGGRRTTAVALVGLAGIMALAGCGSTKSAAPPTTRTPPTAAPTSTIPATTVPGPTVPSTTAAPTTPTTTSPPTTPAPTTAPPTTTPPTTAPAIPSDPQPSADGAATALIHAWAAGDRADALTVATAAAVGALFAVAYPSGAAIDRGCSDPTFLPVVCSWGPPGGGNSADSLFELSLGQAGPNWYVSSVDVES